jgi:hypothetical protein
MNKKKNFRPKDEKFNVFVPLVNLLLFEKFESPGFESDNEKLSQNFIEATKITNQKAIEENYFFINTIYNFLTKLSDEQRAQVYNNIVENDVYIGATRIIYIMKDNLSFDEESTFISQAEILKDLFEFKEEVKLSKAVFYYFIFQFEHIMYLIFSDLLNISKTEYENIISNIGEDENFKISNNVNFEN